MSSELRPTKLEREVRLLEEALRAERAKSEAFTNASHEVRTLLSGVLGMTALLLDGELSSQQRDHARRIRASGDALLALVNDFLDFAKSETGQITVETQDFDVRRVVEEVGEIVAERASTRGLDLYIYVHAGVPSSVRGDSSRLRQVLLNLVTNAIKFTEHGEVVLRVTAGPRRSKTELLRFEVADTGVGIEPAWLARIFEPFAQAVKNRGGTGLGLTIASQIAEAMGGTLSATSEVGTGSSFSLVVPFERVQLAVPRGTLPRAELEHRRTLVVSASATGRQILTEQLRGLGLDVEARADEELASAALETAVMRKKPFELLLCEADLGKGSGYALAGHIDGRFGAAGPRVVLMAYPGAPRPPVPANVVATLLKPVRHGDLAATMQKVLSAADDRVELKSLVDDDEDGAVEVTKKFTARVTLLVVEDDFVNQKVTTFMLQKRGFLVDVASSGREAVERMTKQTYGAIFMDCHLPGIDGFEASALVRKRERELGLGQTPIIALTADARGVNRDRCLAAGMSDFLTKPLVAPDLDAVLAKWCAPRAPKAKRKSSSRLPSARAAEERAPRSSGPEPSSSKRQLAPSPARRNAPTPEDRRALNELRRVETKPREVETARPMAPSGGAAQLDADTVARLREMRQDSGAPLLAELAVAYVDDAKKRILAMRAAVKENDPGTFHQMAHALKGASAQLGAQGVTVLAARLERLARSGDLHDGKSLLYALELEVDRARIALEAEIEREPNATGANIRRITSSRL